MVSRKPIPYEDETPLILSRNSLMSASSFCRRGSLGTHTGIIRLISTCTDGLMTAHPPSRPPPHPEVSRLVLRGAEDVVGADPAPHDVGLTCLDLFPELPGGPPVGCEGHLHDAPGPLYGLHPQARPERPARLQVLDEAADRNAEAVLIGGAERLPVLVEAWKPLVGRHLPE